jgi:hypothetical protein
MNASVADTREAMGSTIRAMRGSRVRFSVAVRLGVITGNGAGPFASAQSKLESRSRGADACAWTMRASK